MREVYQTPDLFIVYIFMCQYLRPWRMGQKFKLHTLKFCQCPAPTRRAVTQSAGGAAVNICVRGVWVKIQVIPLCWTVLERLLCCSAGGFVSAEAHDPGKRRDGGRGDGRRAGSRARSPTAVGVVTQPCSHGVTQPCSHGVTQPCSHGVTQPCRHGVTQPCSHGARWRNLKRGHQRALRQRQH